MLVAVRKIQYATGRYIIPHRVEDDVRVSKTLLQPLDSLVEAYFRATRSFYTRETFQYYLILQVRTQQAARQQGIAELVEGDEVKSIVDCVRRTSKVVSW